MATPHTRGSTCLGKVFDCGLSGYPAHAGIDHSSPIFSGGCPRLPRTRGDRPYLLIQLNIPHLATPHTRGSTFSFWSFWCLP